MDELGQYSLILAFALCLYLILLSLIGKWRGDERLLRSAEVSFYAVFALVSLAILCLSIMLVTSRFENAYVSRVTSLHLPLPYKLAALWGGQAGSLLFWGWLLTVYGVVAIRQGRKRHGALMPYVQAIIGATTAFFLALNLFAANPFARLVEVFPDGRAMPFTPRDGSGLNPLLQHPVMMIHPPILYLGYVGFVVPFAFAMAALATRQSGVEWTRSIRRWTLVSWFFLGGGILLGAYWAYEELGWGGYWAWDPVENASLMPWLTATAFLHSIMVQERRGMLRMWNYVLIIATHLLCLFGTFLTRSGIVSSVHAFAQSSIGAFFVSFMVITATLSLGLLGLRSKDLKSENRLDSVASRESAFLFNNLLLLLACFAVFWGTLFPVFSEAVTGEKVTVGPPFFNLISIPIGLCLLFLMGAAPLLAWRKTSPEGIRRSFVLPCLAGIVGILVSAALGIRMYAVLLSFGLSAFVIAGVAQEFGKGLRARKLKHGESYGIAMVKLFRKHQRRYGGYAVHVGVVFMAVGITGTVFDRDTHGDLHPGESLSLGRYRLVCREIEEDYTSHSNYAFAIATLDIYQGERLIKTLYPERRIYYTHQEQPTSEIGIYSTLREDLYVVLAGLTEDRQAILQIYLNPLVKWLWIGGIILMLGTGICLIPPLRIQESISAVRSSAPVVQTDLKSDQAS